MLKHEYKRLGVYWSSIYTTLYCYNTAATCVFCKVSRCRCSKVTSAYILAACCSIMCSYEYLINRTQVTAGCLPDGGNGGKCVLFSAPPAPVPPSPSPPPLSPPPPPLPPPPAAPDGCCVAREGGCRADGGEEYTTYKDQTLAQCAALCDSADACTAYEVNTEGNCEVHRTVATHTKPGDATCYATVLS